jgi:hypothetical protein
MSRFYFRRWLADEKGIQVRKPYLKTWIELRFGISISSYSENPPGSRGDENHHQGVLFFATQGWLLGYLLNKSDNLDPNRSSRDIYAGEINP